MLKKFLKVTLILIFGIGLFFNLISASQINVFAADSTTTVITTEKLPGMGCELKSGSKTGVTTQQYECTIKGGFESVTDILTGLIKYATFIVILLTVLILVFSGIRMSVEGKKEEVIKQFKRVLIGLIVLFLIGFILNTVAPWIYK